MFRKPKVDAHEEIIFDCPGCQEQLLVNLPPRKKIIIECEECGARFSVQTARKAKKTQDQVKQDWKQPELVVEEIIPEIGKKADVDIVRAPSLKPGGKAALERARQAREARSRRASVPSTAPASAPPVASAPPTGPERRRSSRNSGSHPYMKKECSSTGVTPLLSSSRIEDNAFPPLDDEKE